MDSQLPSHNYVYLYLICFDECFVLAHLDFFSLILLMNDMLIHCSIFVQLFDPEKDISWRSLLHCVSLITKTTGAPPTFMYRAKLTV